MESEKVKIVDVGRGPQIEGSRLTVMDVFYYLHRGCDFDFIRGAMRTLTREQFDAVVEYVNEHREELIAEDLAVEERIRKDIAEQEARGLRPNRSLPLEQRMQLLREKLRKRQAKERSGGRVAG